MLRWIVYETDDVKKTFEKLPSQIQRKYKFWLELMMHEGHQAVRKFSGFKDEVLKGKWLGHRASRLNKKYRVIYRIDKSEVIAYVKKIDPHKYR